jgi:hypothetical protein
MGFALWLMKKDSIFYPVAADDVKHEARTKPDVVTAPG